MRFMSFHCVFMSLLTLFIITVLFILILQHIQSDLQLSLSLNTNVSALPL